jgi:hypothetical protein
VISTRIYSNIYMMTAAGPFEYNIGALASPPNQRVPASAMETLHPEITLAWEPPHILSMSIDRIPIECLHTLDWKQLRLTLTSDTPLEALNFPPIIVAALRLRGINSVEQLQSELDANNLNDMPAENVGMISLGVGLWASENKPNWKDLLNRTLDL